ncbi:hypothetical protein [Haloarcula salina]|uniref:Uncharacterized protein n=1 Tax=Haloarcula salina TaxID=1429914 RepID=A0AA41KJB0_9EURY|nr:hypothetical protein [Haloarcula salina]MBV0902558.1 hypothetical protein [Haloarcula salina]
MSHRSLTVAVTLCLVLAGCSAFSAVESEPVRTVTPAPVPTSEPSLPPGVTTSGVDDYERLAAAHREILERESYTVEFSRTVRLANGTTVRRLVGGRIVGDDGASRTWERATGSAQHSATGFVGQETWANASVQVVRFRYANGTSRYTVITADQQYPYRGTGLAVSESLVAEDASLVDTDTDPATYTLLARNLSGYRARTAALDRTETSSLRVVVTGEGLVQRATVRYTGPLDGTRAAVNTTIRYDVGPRSVERPAWVERAFDRRSRTETAEARAAD